MAPPFRFSRGKASIGRSVRHDQSLIEPRTRALTSPPLRGCARRIQHRIRLGLLSTRNSQPQSVHSMNSSGSPSRWSVWAGKPDMHRDTHVVISQEVVDASIDGLTYATQMR
jgi:hypothetical protein